jgi:cytochrome b-561
MSAPHRNQAVTAGATPTAPRRFPRGWSWLDERLGVGQLYHKYGRKAFPVHSTFFLGEMALFAFIILVLTGIYLGFIYVPSNAEITVDGETLPEAYASVRLIESIPVANLFRNTHHWAAHVMVAATLLHLLRIFFTGTYRKPREINWVIGVVLLALTLAAGFVGYALPYDAYAVTATGIGYGIARSIPWIGPLASEFIFGGPFPTLGSLARLYTFHIFVIPALLTAVMTAHLLIIVKQKHSQPGYARRMAEPGKVLGVPLWPYQALLAGELLLLMFGALFLLSAIVPPHPLEAFGPPSPTTPEVRPDWYLMWVYGFLRIIPAGATFTLLGATISPNFLGGVLFPALLFGLMTLAPWIDRTNRRAVRRFEYLEPVRQSPLRLATGVATLVFIGTLFIAAYYDAFGLTLGQIWAIVIGVPIVVGVLTWVGGKATTPTERFDPRGSDVPVEPDAAAAVAVSRPESEPRVTIVTAAPAPPEPAAPERDGADEREPDRPAFSTPAARADRARDSLVVTLHELGELAPLVRQLDDEEELLEVLSYVDSLRLGLAESNQTLQGVARGALADDEPVVGEVDLRRMEGEGG